MPIENEFKTVRELVLHTLEKYPETRNSDTKLYIRCLQELGAETLDDVESINLNMISVHKIRQKVQNKEGLFKPDKYVKELRNQRRKEIRELMKKSS